MSVKEITRVDYSAKCLQPTQRQVIEEFQKFLNAYLKNNKVALDAASGYFTTRIKGDRYGKH